MTERAEAACECPANVSRADDPDLHCSSSKVDADIASFLVPRG